jgi:hypothetical protein
MVAQHLYDSRVSKDKDIMTKYFNTSISVPKDIIITEENINIFIFSHVEAHILPGIAHEHV